VVAARDLFAHSGPGAVSIRAVAEAAGCSHTLVGRHFGSKAGLEAAVIERLATGLNVLVTRQCSDPDWSMATVLKAMRDHPSAAKIILRAALGEFDATPLVKGHNIALCLAEWVEEKRGGDPRSPSATSRVTAYLSLSTVLGYLALEDQLVHAVRVADVSSDLRDGVVVSASQTIIRQACDRRLDLSWTSRSESRPRKAKSVTTDESGEESLLRAAIELYSERGPGNVTTRDIAERAGVNQGLIYHYFASREALIARAIEVANLPIVQTSKPTGGFDLGNLIRSRPDLTSLVIIARYLLDGGRILDVRRSFPVFEAVLAGYDEVPTGDGPGTLADPRFAALTSSALFEASAIVDRALRRMLKIPTTADVTSAQAWAVDLLLSQAA
jgi:AcrR family transcriptional regulator